MIKEETNWEDELMKVREQTHYPHLKTTRCFVVEDLKQFISKLISQEREKWVEEVKKQVIPKNKFGTPNAYPTEEENLAWDECVITMKENLINLIQK